MVVHAFNLKGRNLGGRNRWHLCEFKVSLVYVEFQDNQNFWSLFQNNKTKLI